MRPNNWRGKITNALKEHSKTSHRRFSCNQFVSDANAKKKKKKKKLWVTTFVVFMFFSACPHLHACLHSLWFYVTAGMKIRDHLQYKLAQGSHVFFRSKNISGTWSICADVCARVSGNFHPNFHYNAQEQFEQCSDSNFCHITTCSW